MKSDSLHNKGFVDINCDMGEGIGNDEAIMPFISSANISCGWHAGDEITIKETIKLAAHYNVSVGAHPSFADKDNFGRVEMDLTPRQIHELITEQLMLFKSIAKTAGTRMRHVKPHGALYNNSAKDSNIAKAIAMAIKEFDLTLILFGLSGSHSIKEAQSIGLRTINEVFADRSYQDDGTLTPRSMPGALIEDVEKSMQQVLQMVKENKVSTISGKIIPIEADSICIHGDGEHAVEFAQNIYEQLIQNNIGIKAF